MNLMTMSAEYCFDLCLDNMLKTDFKHYVFLFEVLLKSINQFVFSSRFMMEGVGARVIRGIDWKWGKFMLNNI